jgi:ribosome-associated protein
MEKLMERLEKAAKVPKSRTATKPTRASVRNRLEEKKRNSQRKLERRKPVDD